MKRVTKGTILFRILAVIMTGLAILLCYLEYMILCAIGAIGSGIAAWLGATGAAAGGIVLLSYIAVTGLIMSVVVAILGSSYAAWWLFTH